MANYITGFVIGTASLCVTVMSPLIGYIVSTSTIVKVDAVQLYHKLASLYFVHFSFTVGSLLGSEVYTICWTVVGWRITHSVWVQQSNQHCMLCVDYMQLQ